MRRKILAGCTAAVLLVGCSATQTDQTSDTAIRCQDAACYHSAYNVYENGLIYTDYARGRVQFLDYETMQLIPLCNKPNCTHSGLGCISKTVLSGSEMAVAYHDFLYHFTTTWQIVDNDDGKSQEVEQQSKCMRISLRTGIEETVAEIPDLALDDTLDVALVDGTLYAIGSTEWKQAEDGSWSAVGRSGKQYLLGIELETGTVTNYGLVNDNPCAEYNDGNFSEVTIDGIYQNRIYMHYRYVEDPNAFDKFTSNPNMSDEEMQQFFDTISWKFENKCLDLQTGTVSKSDLPYACFASGDVYVGIENGCFCLWDADGTVTPAKNLVYDGENRFVTMVNGKLWYGAIHQGFDPETGTALQLSQAYAEQTCYVMDYVDGHYIVEIQDNGNVTFEAVTEEALLES